MKPLGIVTVITAALLFALFGLAELLARYQFERDYTNLWSLAEKSSTIPAKRDYVARFLEAIEAGNARGEFAAHNAMVLKTPDNSLRANVDALHTLATRLDEISGMDPGSFEYNTAIQQITAQEQDEAGDLMNVVWGCYVLANWPIVWKWIGGVVFVGTLVVGIGGAILWVAGND